MSRADRARWTLVVGVALGSLVLGSLVWGFAAEVFSKEPAKADPDEVLFPPNHSVLLTGEVDVICRSKLGELEVEGELIDWEPFESLGVAHASLYSGRSRIQIGSRTIEVFVARRADEPGGPDGWPLCRSHPIDGHGQKRCAACHETRPNGDRVRIGRLKSYKACFECHKSVEFELIHSHPLEPIEHCQMCHAIHGSPRKALLKAPVKKLCDKCHES